jgi:4-hydroxy-2-oxoheptanedioate aldolase
MMRPNRVKRVMDEGGLALATHMGGLADPQIVELIGLAGFDGVFIDLEHTALDLRDVQALVMAAEGAGVTPIVRPPGLDPGFILRLLDIGVQGLLLPHVTSAALAYGAVNAVRYPPQGERGMMAASRAAGYGRVGLRDHIEQSNREILLGCLIEDVSAVERIEEIVAVPGIDVIGVGPNDMSRALGVSGHPDHPDLLMAIERVRAAVLETDGVRLAIPLDHAAFPRGARQLAELGVSYANCAPTPEARLLASWQAQTDGAREQLAARV